MISDLSLGLPWLVVSILPFVLGFVFCYYYFKTKDEIKLIFASAYLIASTTFITHINPMFETNWLFAPLHEWGALPIISAILLTTLNSLKKMSKKTIWYSYSFFLCLTALLMVIPTPINAGSIFQVMTVLIIPSSIILFVKNKNILGLMFILSISCFAIAGVAVSQNLDTLFISTWYIFGFIFTGFVLRNPQVNSVTKFDSCFNLEKQLEITQEELEYSKNEMSIIAEKFRTLLKLIADPVVIVNSKGVFLELNNAVEEKTGFTKDELIGTNFLKTKMITAKSKAILVKNLAKRMMGVHIDPYEIEVNTKSGDKLQVELNAKKIEYEGAEADLVVFRDVTERKKIINELKESEERYKYLSEDVMALILKTDTKGKITYVNRIIEDYGYKKEDLIGKSQKNFVPRRNWLRLLKVLKTVKSGKQITGELPIKTPKGIILVEFRSRPIFDKNKVVGILTVIRDITDRKEMEKKLERHAQELEIVVEERTKNLKESQEKLQSIFDSSPNSIVVTDLNGRIVDCILATVDMHGYSSKDELIGKNSLDLIGKEDQKKIKKELGKALKIGPVTNVEYMFIKKDGSEFPVELSVSAVKDFNGKPIGFIAISSDISKRKSMELQLKEYAEGLEFLVEKRTKKLKETQMLLVKSEKFAAIGELSTMVAHDLRNPLQGISGAVYYLKKNIDASDNDKIIQMVHVLEKNVKYSEKIISDLLDYSKELKIDVQETSIKQLIGESLKLTQIPESIKVFNKTKDTPLVLIDQLKMKRVFINLITNSFDAMPNGGVFYIYQNIIGDRLEISFEDNGVGIESSILKKVWNPLFTTKAKGMGFGLSICKRIVEAHNGEIWVESELGKGTIFTLSIPLKPKLDEGMDIWIKNQDSNLVEAKTKSFEDQRKKGK